MKIGDKKRATYLKYLKTKNTNVKLGRTRSILSFIRRLALLCSKTSQGILDFYIEYNNDENADYGGETSVPRKKRETRVSI